VAETVPIRQPKHPSSAEIGDELGVLQHGLRPKLAREKALAEPVSGPCAEPNLTPPSRRRDILRGEAIPGGPSKGEIESMARRRYQKPAPRREGRQWVIYYWDDEFVDGERRRKKKRHVLGPASMGAREAEKVRDEVLRPLNQGLVNIGSATKFADYVESVYQPVVLPTKAKSTQDRAMSVYENYLGPAFGEVCLRDITPLSVQRYVSGMAGWNLSQESKDKVRDVLSSILGSAVEYTLLVKNPVAGVRLPCPKSGKRSKPYIAQPEFDRLLKLVVEPYATMIFVALYTGLRVSELIGLHWRNVRVEQNKIAIEERYCRGDWGAPKSQASNATIEVNRAVTERIQRLKTLTVEVRAGRAVRRYPAVKSGGPDDLVFQSVRKGGPMRDNNILARHIKPAARAIGQPWINWQVLRRSFAMLLKKNGADLKDAQGLMRHSRASTTLDVYMQFDSASQREVVDRLVA
jgi:integrase